MASQLPHEAGSPRSPQLKPDAPNWLQLLQGRFGCNVFEIRLTEHRGITLNQLRQAVSFMRIHCCKLHDTAPSKYSRTSGQKLDMEFMNLYHVNEWLIKPSTKSHNCAFVELVAATDQPPRWYTSHWWGEPVEDFVKCLELHAELRILSDPDAWWICAYANRQHDLGSELVTDPKQTSFYRAMLLSEGLLLVVDSGSGNYDPGTVFSRIWVQFEMAMTFEFTETQDFQLDIATTCNSEPFLLRHGICDSQSWHEDKYLRPRGCGGNMSTGTCCVNHYCCSCTGPKTVAHVKARLCSQHFPVDAMETALTAEIEKAAATCEEDRRRILNCIAKRPYLELDQEVLPGHESYVLTDGRFRSHLAHALWPMAVRTGKVRALGVGPALAMNKTRQSLQLSLVGLGQEDLEGLCTAIAGLDMLADVTLHFRRSSILSLAPLAQALSNLVNLKYLEIILSGSEQLRELGPFAAVVAGMPMHSSCHFNFNSCSQLSTGELSPTCFALQNRVQAGLASRGMARIYAYNCKDISCEM